MVSNLVEKLKEENVKHEFSKEIEMEEEKIARSKRLSESEKGRGKALLRSKQTS